MVTSGVADLAVGLVTAEKLKPILIAWRGGSLPVNSTASCTDVLSDIQGRGLPAPVCCIFVDMVCISTHYRGLNHVDTQRCK